MSTTKPEPKTKALKTLTLEDLNQVVGGAPKIKIVVENASGTSKASGEG